LYLRIPPPVEPFAGGVLGGGWRKYGVLGCHLFFIFLFLSTSSLVFFVEV
jgi:hypothetical protein